MTIMMTEEHISYVRQYLGLLETVEKAFAYITEKDVMEQPEAIDKIIPDILAACVQINESNTRLVNLFEHNEMVKKHVDGFNHLVTQLETDLMIEMNTFSNPLIKRTSSAFINWKALTERDFIKMVQQ